MVEVQGMDFFIPLTNVENWRWVLADPEKQWKQGYSARTLAYCWIKSDGFPPEVRKAFKDSGIKLFRHIEPIMAFPEYQVRLPPIRSHPSQNDLFILAKSNDELVSIMVEGKISESFGKTVSEWMHNASKGKKERLSYLCEILGLDEESTFPIKYQLIHRAASAVITAERFNAKNALMIIHSFSRSYERFDDFESLAGLFGTVAEVNKIYRVTEINRKNLFLGWIKGNQDYLEY